MYRKSLIYLSLLASVSCNNSEPEISETYVIKTNSNSKNVEDLRQIRSTLDQISTDLINTETLNIPEAARIQFRSFSLSDVKKVLLKEEVAKLFDPENSKCAVPDRVKKKLNKLKKDGKNWAPEYVVNFMKNLPDSALYLPRTSLSVLLHSVEIKSATVPRNWIVLGSPTFKNLEVEKYIIREGFDAFLYTLDCSGYLNAAIEGSGAIPGADIKSSAKSALEKKSSMFIGGGVMLSPLTVAFYGNVLGVSLDTADRIKILDQLINIPDTQETDSIICPLGYEVIWASDEGTSSFNGEASFAARVGGSFGIAKISATGEAGGKLSRESSFNSYKTYFTKSKVISDLKPFTVAQVRSLKNSLKRH